jgi:hypothetical protein
MKGEEMKPEGLYGKAERNKAKNMECGVEITPYYTKVKRIKDNDEYVNKVGCKLAEVLGLHATSLDEDSQPRFPTLVGNKTYIGLTRLALHILLDENL